MELSRPTVKGRTACGKRTVSRTGKTGTGRLPFDSSLPSALLTVGLITLTKSFAIECPSIRLSDIRCSNCCISRKQRNHSGQPPFRGPCPANQYNFSSKTLRFPSKTPTPSPVSSAPIPISQVDFHRLDHSIGPLAASFKDPPLHLGS